MQTGDATIQKIARRCFSNGEGGTEVIDHPVKMGPLTLTSAMTTMHPVTMPDTRWWLVIASGLDDVDAVVQKIFSRAVFWAIFVIVTVTALFVSASFFMIRSRIRIERMRRQLLTNELEQARQIQLAWLPDRKRQTVSINVAAANVPASHISGDFYNWFDLPDGRSVVLIGDVTGHGIAAAFLMATTQLLVRMTMMSHGNTCESLREVNRQLCAQGFSGQFVTMLLLVLNGNRVEIATAGHPSPLICEDGVIRELELEPQLVLGVESNTDYVSRAFELAEGASVPLYTDGVPDVLSADGKQLKLNGLKDSLAGKRACDAQSLIDMVLRTVDRFRDQHPLSDDLTLVAIQLSARSEARAGTLSRSSSA